MTKSRNPLIRIFSAAGRGLDVFRRVVANLLFVIVLIVLIVVLRGDAAPSVKSDSALVVAVYGDLVEEHEGDSLQQALDRMAGAPPSQTRVRDVVKALDHAREDDRVELVLLELTRMGGGQLSKLQEIGRALTEFRAAGKSVVAYADSYGQGAWYLAAMADEVYLNPMGMVRVEGFAVYPYYFAELLNKLDVDVNVFRAGENKSAVEPYVRRDMSPASRELTQAWLDELWSAYREDAAAARGMDAEDIQQYVDGFADLLEQHDGDAAQVAVATGLVTAIATRDEVRAMLRERVADEGPESYRHIDHRNYLLATRAQREAPRGAASIGVITASGMILDGSRAPSGAVGGDTLVRLIRQAREDNDIEALVLRVDSPGGSAFASELVRRELELTQAEGTPVVVSMGSVAASGGYWIAMSADRILASPTTITGSIGVFGIVPTYQRTLEKIGVHTDGVGTTRLAGGTRLDRELHPDAARAFQTSVDRIYRQFVNSVAEARDLDATTMEDIADGRIWSGASALELGLVDALGDFDEALAAAAELAGVETWHAVRIERELSFFENLVVQMGGGMSGAAIQWLPQSLRPLAHSLEHPLLKLADPRGVYAWCACDATTSNQ